MGWKRARQTMPAPTRNLPKILSVSRRGHRLLLYLFDDKTTLNAHVRDHAPVYLAIEAKLGDKLLLEVSAGLRDFCRLVGKLGHSRKVLSRRTLQFGVCFDVGRR